MNVQEQPCGCVLTSHKDVLSIRYCPTHTLNAANNNLGRKLHFDEFTSINYQRAKRWHHGDITMWSVSDWLMAMAGEAGEACNAGKKLRRIEEQIDNLSEDPDRQLSDREAAVDKIAEELADTVIYCDLVATRISRTLTDAIIAKFNLVSIRYGFPERL